MVTRVRGAQIKDESIESADIASGSIKAGELNAEAVTGQTVLTSGLDLNNDRFLIWDADANSLKQMPPVVFSMAMGSGGAGSSSPYFFPMSMEGFDEQIFTTGSFGFSNPVSVPKMIGTDVFFYVSGSRGKMGTAVTGSIVLGGDTMVSGSVYLNGVESANDETFIQFKEDGDDRAKIGVNTSNNIIIHNQYTNKHIVFKVNDAGVTREGLRINGAVPEVVVNEGSESLVDFRVESNSKTHMLFVDGGNERVGIGTDAPNFDLHVAGEIGVDQYIRHNGNPNTHINFTDDKILLKAGNKAMITMEEKGSSPHEITINDGGNNIDFVIEDNSGDTLLMTDADISSVLIGADSTNSADTNFFVSGSTRSRGTTTRGTALFGGDLVVSGTLTAIQKHICTAKYTMDNADKQFIRFNAAGSNSTAGVNNKFVAPVQGSLSFIMIRSTGTPGQTAIGFHRSTDGTTDLGSTPVDTQNIVMNNADTAYKIMFTQAANFGPGDIVGLSVDPAANHGNVDITLVFELDFTM